MSERWVDELMPDEPKWVRDMVDEELEKRAAGYDALAARLAEAERLLKLNDGREPMPLGWFDSVQIFLAATSARAPDQEDARHDE